MTGGIQFRRGHRLCTERSRSLQWKPLIIAGLCFAGDLGAWLLFRQRVSRLFLIALMVTLGEAVGPAQMLGGLVVLAGIYLARRGS